MNGSDGVELIAEERQRQIEEEGWSPGHDDTHSDGSMALAAACYCVGPENVAPNHGSDFSKKRYRLKWPWDDRWHKPKDRVRDLVRAGALIAAEIDRIQRLEGGDGE